MIKFWRTVCLISLGGFVESNFGYEGQRAPLWFVALLVSGCGWTWAAYGTQVREALKRRLYAFAGRPAPPPETDPAALAAEIVALNRQVAALRDTAASFDVSFGETLKRLDERLGRVEQQSAYIPATDPAPPPRRERPLP